MGAPYQHAVLFGENGRFVNRPYDHAASCGVY